METVVVPQPFYHMAGKVVALSAGLYSGAKLVVNAQFDYHQFLLQNAKFKVKTHKKLMRIDARFHGIPEPMTSFHCSELRPVDTKNHQI